MNEATPTRPAIGTKVRFAADFRINEGVIDSYTRSGRAVVVVEGHKQYTLTLDQLIMLETKAMNPQQNIRPTPVFELDENVLVNLTNMPAKVVMVGSDGQTVNVVFGDGYEAHTVPVASVMRPASPSPFKIGDAVEVGVPAKVVGVSADGLTLEVIYEDMLEVFEADACNVTLLTEEPQAVVRRVAELERQVAELQRQVTTLLQALDSTPHS